MSARELEQGIRLACKMQLEDLLEIDYLDELLVEILENSEEEIWVETVEKNKIESEVDKGKIRSIKTMDDVHHYDNINHKHDHFICVKCGLIEDVDKMNEDIKTINCNHVLDCDITYKGICKKCI